MLFEDYYFERWRNEPLSSRQIKVKDEGIEGAGGATFFL
jgi:hypothetical protein